MYSIMDTEGFLSFILSLAPMFYLFLNESEVFFIGNLVILEIVITKVCSFLRISKTNCANLG